MKRRVFLGATGSLASVGTLAYTTREPIETLEIRFWLSERAASYDGAVDRIFEYLDALLSLEFWTLDLSFGGTVQVSTEDGARVTSRGEWPAAILSGAIGRRDITPAADVNVLVTDGQMTQAPTGYGLPHIASVGGARHIAALESLGELLSSPDADADRKIVPNRRTTRTMQILVHEIGHALGLGHDHGVSFRYGDAIVATPMLSSYAWTDDYDGDQSRCGTSYADPAGRSRKLSLAFSACARRELADYSGGITG
ncbi:peptidase M10A and M12B matrixin and adamalysin [Natronorubrum sp. JWXQ-INN-674]|uniref:Peptidase M10A and M12B matrixin and adamalysin n=1 Tax=Natronorubrum halalkaliphilum TaxID=2691917 RepID=A0A6B0VII4_9EURY|nr:peptidase M10A and M12B matrixin and adamalysin [Natronorubrum halalkaliphilum]MXV60897.1 peptidase M10A and M12B matrixin and adamalysin [Natronorubrum halalkaliphilum]